MKTMLTWLISRLKEKGTWLHLLNAVITATGATLNPELKEAILTVGVSIATLIGVMTTEKPKDPPVA